MTSEWLIGVVQPSEAEFTALKMAEKDVEVLNFRWIKRRVVRERGVVAAAYDQYFMLPGYLFLKGRAASEIRDLPFAPRLLKADDEFRVVSNNHVISFMLWVSANAPAGSIFEGDKILFPYDFEPQEAYGSAHRMVARRFREMPESIAA